MIASFGNFASERTPDVEGRGEGVCVREGLGGGGAPCSGAGDPMDGSEPSATSRLSSGPGGFCLFRVSVLH